MIDQLAMFFIVLREGTGALLLLMLFNQTASSMEQRRWMISGALGGVAVPLAVVSFASSFAETYQREIDMIANLAVGMILIYVFFWSRHILSHVQEHATRTKSSYYNAKFWGGPLVMVSSWFIVASAVRSLMLWNSYNGDPVSTTEAILVAGVALFAVAFGFDKISKAINIGTFFRVSGWIFLIMGLHCLWEGAEKTIDMFPQMQLYFDR